MQPGFCGFYKNNEALICASLNQNSSLVLVSRILSIKTRSRFRPSDEESCAEIAFSSARLPTSANLRGVLPDLLILMAGNTRFRQCGDQMDFHVAVVVAFEFFVDNFVHFGTVSTSAVRRIVRLPPSSILRAAPKKALGRSSAMASTGQYFADEGMTVLYATRRTWRKSRTE